MSWKCCCPECLAVMEHGMQSYWHFFSSDSLIHEEKYKYNVLQNKSEKTSRLRCIYSLSSGVWKLFLVLIASDKIKHPTSGEWSELCDCNYCNSVALRMWEAPGLKQNMGFVSTQFWPHHTLKGNEPSWKRELLSRDNDSLSHLRAAFMQILFFFWNCFQSRTSLNNRLKHG